MPVVCTGNDFSTLYAPLIRDGRMEKFYWAPTREDRVGVCTGIFQHDGVVRGDIETLVDTFPGQSIDFFGALRVSGSCLSLAPLAASVFPPGIVMDMLPGQARLRRAAQPFTFARLGLMLTCPV